MLHVPSIFVEHVQIFREIKKRRRAQEKATLMTKYDNYIFIWVCRLPKLYLCEFCLKYMKSTSILMRHMVRTLYIQLLINLLLIT